MSSESACPQSIIAAAGSEVECSNGRARNGGTDYPCKDVHLESIVPFSELGSASSASGNDIWGWTQYDDNGVALAHYALTGQSDGASIVDISDLLNPKVIAFIKTNKSPFKHVIWRDIKIYEDYMFIVADTSDHKLQIVNLPT